MDSLDNVQHLMLPEDLCNDLLDVSKGELVLSYGIITRFQVIRKNYFKFQRINKEEEPPLRMLDHGLYGEYVYLSPQQKEPNPYVLRSGEKCYHAFRLGWTFSMNLPSRSKVVVIRYLFPLGLTKMSVMRKPTTLNFFVPFTETPSMTIRPPSGRFCPTVVECPPTQISRQRFPLLESLYCSLWFLLGERQIEGASPPGSSEDLWRGREPRGLAGQSWCQSWAELIGLLTLRPRRCSLSTPTC